MNISKFKLINDGYTGIKITSVEPIRQGNATILDSVNRERKYPIPEELRKKIQKLKYFYLNLTGHWVSPFNKVFDVETLEVIPPDQEAGPSNSYLMLTTLLNHTSVTGVTVENGGFSMTGTIEAVEGKKMGYSTAFVTEEDDLSFFLEATQKIGDVFTMLTDVMTSDKALPFDAQQVLKAIGVKSNSLEGMDEQSLVDNVISNLEQRGAIVLIHDDDYNESKPKSNISKKTGSIDSHNVKEAEKVDDESQSNSIADSDAGEWPESNTAETTGQDDDTSSEDNPFDNNPPEDNDSDKPKEPVKHKPASSSLSSDKGFPDLGNDDNAPERSDEDLSNLEHSSAMGIEDGPGVEQEGLGEGREW